MYMAQVRSDDLGITIHLYKHEDTRRYINLDDSCRAYAFVYTPSIERTETSGGRYRRLAKLATAVKHLDLNLLETGELYRSYPPSDWIEF